MKHKLSILGALILSLAITGSTFASSGDTKPKQNKTVAGAKNNLVKTAKPKRHRKHRKTKTAKKMKSNTTMTTPKK